MHIKFLFFLVLSICCRVFVNAQPTALSLAERTALADSARVLSDADSMERVIEVFDQIIYSPDGNMVTDSLSGALLNHKGRILRRALRRPADAISAYKERIKWQEAQADVDDAKRLLVYHYLGSVSFFEKEYDTSREALRLADHYARQADAPDHFIWLDALRLLGNIAADDYDADLIRSVTRKGTALYEDHVKDGPDSNRHLLGREVYLDAADARDRIGDQQEARDLAQRALEIARQIDDGPGMIRTLNLVAVTEGAVGNTEAANRYFNKALDLYDKDPGNQGEISYIYNNLALMYQKEGRNEEAAASFRKAIETLKDYRYVESVSGQLSDLALCEARLGRVETADSLHARAIEIISYNHSFKRGGELLAVLDSVDLYFELLTVYDSRLTTLLELKRLRPALEVAEEMQTIQEILRSQVITDGSRRFNSSIVRTSLDAAVRIAHELYEETSDEAYLWRALNYSERARAYSLLRSVGRNQLLLPEKERIIRTKIAALSRRAFSEPAVLPELDRLRIELRKMVADGGSETRSDLDALALKKWLRDEQTTLMAYHLTESRNYVFKLTPAGTLTMTAIDTSADLKTMVAEWRESILASAYRGKSLLPAGVQTGLDEKYVALGTRLRKLLFPGGLPPAGRLCLIPDGELQFLPFAALPIEANDGETMSYDKRAYLGGQCQLQLTYTAELLLRNAAAGKPEENISFLGMAPSFQGDNTVLAYNENTQKEGPLTRGAPGLKALANNQDEVNAVSGFFPGDGLLFDGPAATRDAFIQEAGRARVIHLSTHGVVNATEPSLSFIAFAQSRDSLYNNDLLYFNDLAMLPLNADLAVLAACETSLGKLSPGETPLSMASAFTAAGARATVTTLWQVDDAATRELMVAFYEALAAGKTKAQALSSAQASLIAGGEYAHPYYWSGAVLHGNNEALELTGSAMNYWLLGGIVAFGLGLGLLLGVRRLKA